MKILVQNYTFDASEKKITFTDYNPIVIERVLLVTNITDGIIIYNFADPDKGGTVADNVLTLEYNTTAMDDGDKLQIFYDDVATSQLVDLGENNDVTLVTLPDTAGGDLADIETNTDSLAVVGGGAEATALRVTIANDSTGVVTVDDGGGALTVDGTVAVTNADITSCKTALELLDNAVDGNYLNVNCNIAGTDFVGGAGAVAAGVQRVTLASNDPAVVDLAAIEVLLGTIDADTGAIKTATELIDNAISGAGFNVTQFAGAAVPIGAGTEAAALRVTLATDSTGVVSIDDNGGAITVDGTVTANLSATDNGVLDDISTDTGNIDTKLGTIDTDTGNIATAVQLIDDSIYVDDADWTADTSKHALVGAVTQVATTANTDGDTTPLTTNAFRELRTAIPESDLATAGTAHVKKYYTNEGAVTDGIIWSPVAGKRWYVTDIYIQVSAAATVTLEDDLAGGDSPIWKAELAANSGWSHSFNTPWFSGEDAADLIITTTAGNVYVMVTGYEI